MVLVSNSSPLISLAKIGQLDVLSALFTTIYIAEQVFQETTSQGPGSLLIKSASWIQVNATISPSELDQLKRSNQLGDGELSTILLAKKMSADAALIDERRARFVAKQYDIIVFGTIAVLEQAYRKGLIADLSEIYMLLRSTGTYIHPTLLNNSLLSFNLPVLC
jgi:predicted nucleic acid-binding protein